MIKQAGAGKSLVEPVIDSGIVDEDRFGIDAELIEQRKKHCGLALAVAVTPLPGLVGRCRREVSACDADIDVANLLLDQSQYGARACQRIGNRGSDFSSLFPQRGARSQRRRPLIKRSKMRGHGAPVAKITVFQRSHPLITRRRGIGRG